MRHIDFEDSCKIVLSEDLVELESILVNVLQKEGLFFQKMVFKWDLSDNSSFFYFPNSSSLDFLSLCSKEEPIHEEIFLEENKNMLAAGTLSKLIYSYPCFGNVELHIYENDNVHGFRMIALPIKKNKVLFGYWLVGHYSKELEE